jgi:hypothetical protein
VKTMKLFTSNFIAVASHSSNRVLFQFLSRLPCDFIYRHFINSRNYIQQNEVLDKVKGKRNVVPVLN